MFMVKIEIYTNKIRKTYNTSFYTNLQHRQDD